MLSIRAATVAAFVGLMLIRMLVRAQDTPPTVPATPTTPAPPITTLTPVTVSAGTVVVFFRLGFVERGVGAERLLRRHCRNPLKSQLLRSVVGVLGIGVGGSGVEEKGVETVAGALSFLGGFEVLVGDVGRGRHGRRNGDDLQADE